MLRGVAHIPQKVENIDRLSKEWFPEGNLNTTLLENYYHNPDRWVLRHLGMDDLEESPDDEWRQELLDYLLTLNNPYDFSKGQETFESIMQR